MVLVVQKCNFLNLRLLFCSFCQRQPVAVLRLPPLSSVCGSRWVNIRNSCGKVCFMFPSALPFCAASDAQSASGTRNATGSAYVPPVVARSPPALQKDGRKRWLQPHRRHLHFLHSSWLFRRSGQPHEAAGEPAVCWCFLERGPSLARCAQETMRGNELRRRANFTQLQGWSPN